MGGVMNGLALHGGVIPVGGTFLVFSDYMRGAVRLASISKARVIYSWTHDSVGVGEDGPTHQPIEHIAALRAMPGLRVVRPGDANETASAWRMALVHDGPTALILSRQNVTVLEGTGAPDTVERGAYVLDGDPDPQLVLIGTGSEVALCVSAAGRLREAGVRVRVVSMPCWDLFEEQPESYRLATLPTTVPTLSVEAASIVRMGSLRGRNRRHRPLRRVGAGWSGARETGHQCRQCRRQSARVARQSIEHSPGPNTPLRSAP